MQISRLSSGISFIGKRKKFIFNAFVDLILSNCRDLRIGVT